MRSTPIPQRQEMGWRTRSSCYFRHWKWQDRPGCVHGLPVWAAVLSLALSMVGHWSRQICPHVQALRRSLGDLKPSLGELRRARTEGSSGWGAWCSLCRSLPNLRGSGPAEAWHWEPGAGLLSLLHGGHLTSRDAVTCLGCS